MKKMMRNGKMMKNGKMMMTPNQNPIREREMGNTQEWI
jgi:hypothetical protein